MQSEFVFPPHQHLNIMLDTYSKLCMVTFLKYSTQGLKINIGSDVQVSWFAKNVFKFVLLTSLMKYVVIEQPLLISFIPAAYQREQNYYHNR